MTPKEHRAFVLRRYPGSRIKHTSMGFVIFTRTNICLCDGVYSREMAWSKAFDETKKRMVSRMNKEPFLYD